MYFCDTVHINFQWMIDKIAIVLLQTFTYCISLYWLGVFPFHVKLCYPVALRLSEYL